MTHTRSARLAALGAAGITVITLMLTGCGGMPTGDPTPGPTAADPTPAPTPTVDPVAAAPATRIGVTCDDLATAASVSAIMRGPVAVHDPAISDLWSQPDSPSLYNIRQLGGLECEWTNGVIQGGRDGIVYDYIGARVSVLPDAADQWARYTATYGITGDSFVSCQPVDTFACTFDAFAGDSWISSYVQGLGGIASSEADLAAVAAPFFDAVVARVTAAGASAALPALPAGTLALPTDCEAFITPAQVQAALVTSATLISQRPHGGWSLGAAADQDSGNNRCIFSLTDSDLGVGTISWLPGGGWAVDEIAAAATGSPWEPATVPVTGLLPDEHATVRCIPGDEECYLDMDLGGNLVEVSVWREETGSPSIGTNRQLAAIQMAATVVANLRH